MRAAQDFVLSEPLGVDGTQQTERHHRVLAVEDVVNQPLEVEPATTSRSSEKFRNKTFKLKLDTKTFNFLLSPNETGIVVKTNSPNKLRTQRCVMLVT